MTRRSFWTFSRAEVRFQLAAVGVSLWALAFWLWWRAPIIAGDFVHFYTSGALAFEPHRLYDVATFHGTQGQLVPASAALFYTPVYPPHVALLFSPFTIVPFGVAVTCWILFTIALYVVIVRVVTRHDRGMVLLAALVFPPFIELIAFGQITILVLGACTAGWLALERGRPWLAGFVLGFLSIKPQFGLPFAVAVLAGREWRMLSGAVTSVALQAALVGVTMGTDAFTAYAAILPDIVRNADGLDRVASTSHSLRALFRPLPSRVALVAWGITVVAVLAAVAWVWRSTAPLRIRFGVTMLASVLVNPHLLAYDATMLVVPLIWFAEWRRDRGEETAYWPAIYALILAFLVAPLLPIRATVVVLLWIGWSVCHTARPVVWPYSVKPAAPPSHQ